MVNGLLTAWSGSLPHDWFSYNGYERLNKLAALIQGQEFLLVGRTATMLWVAPSSGENKKKTVLDMVDQVVKEIRNTGLETVVFFATHPLLTGAQSLQIVKFNNNVMFAIWKMRWNGCARIHTVALHHWCLRQNKRWLSIDQIPETDRHMLVFLILDEVLHVLGLVA